MKEVNAKNVRERIAEMESTDASMGLSLQSEFNLACLRKLLPVLEHQEKGEQADLISAPQRVLDEKWNAHFGVSQQPQPSTPQIDNDGREG